MSDKYGYIGIETLLNYCSNDKDHCVTPNDFMRMNRVKIDDRPHGEWYYSCKNGWHCSICQQIVKDMPTVMGKANFDYCPNCGARMRKEGETNG